MVIFKIYDFISSFAAYPGVLSLVKPYPASEI